MWDEKVAEDDPNKSLRGKVLSQQVTMMPTAMRVTHNSHYSSRCLCGSFPRVTAVFRSRNLPLPLFALGVPRLMPMRLHSLHALLAFSRRSRTRASASPTKAETRLRS